MKLFSEIRRRKVIQASIAYAVVGWLLIQLAMALEASLELPPYVDRWTTIGVIAGFPVAAGFFPEAQRYDSNVSRPLKRLYCSWRLQMTRCLLIATIALIAAACARAPADNEATRSAVTELVQRWSDAGEAQDWDVIAETYADAEGFVWIEQGQARYASRAAIVEGLNQARGMSASIRNDVSDIVVTPLGDDAAAFRTRYVLAVTAEGFSYASEGVLSGVAIKQDGVWRFLQGSFSEQAPAEATATTPSAPGE